MPTQPRKAPAKAAPAKKAAAGTTRTRQTKPLMDFATIKAAPTDATMVSRPRESLLDSTPILGWVRDSWAARTERTVKREGKDVTALFGTVVLTNEIPNAAADQVESLIRVAAGRVGCGVKFGEREPGDQPRTVRIRFQTKEKRAYSERKKNK